jgi:hypothetical protein
MYDILNVCIYMQPSSIIQLRDKADIRNRDVFADAVRTGSGGYKGFKFPQALLDECGAESAALHSALRVRGYFIDHKKILQGLDP